MNLSATRVTDNTNEMSLHDLVTNKLQLSIPLFQRPYVWQEKQFSRMKKEILSIIEGEDDNRFLGAVIAVRRFSNPAEPDAYEIVDGQQRLTTLFLFIVAGALVASKMKNFDYAQGLIEANVVISWWKNKPNTKLVPSHKDRGQFNNILGKLLKFPELSSKLAENMRLPDSASAPNGAMEAQFTRIVKFLEQESAKAGEDGFFRLQSIIEAAIARLTFVVILLKDPATATTVFEGLNEAGMPITIGDLVRNEIFARVSRDPQKAIAIHDHKWVPFEKRLGYSFDDYFFPFCISHKANAVRAGMFRELMAIWGKEKSPDDIITHLETLVPAFLAIKAGEMPDHYDPSVRAAVLRLVRLGRPASTFPFIMRLLRSYEEGEVDGANVADILGALESFLVRRALCGVEPTGLLGLFRFMWTNATEAGIPPTANSVSSVILKRLTVEWPTDDRLEGQILNRPLYGSSVEKFVLLEYERSLGADFPDGVTCWVEHIAPQSLSTEWLECIPKGTPKGLLDTWGNLIPLSADMNQGLSQATFHIKKQAYKDGSVFASARKIAEQFDDWNIETIKKRGQTLADWAKTRWPRPATITAASG